MVRVTIVRAELMVDGRVVIIRGEGGDNSW